MESIKITFKHTTVETKIKEIKLPETYDHFFIYMSAEEDVVKIFGKKYKRKEPHILLYSCHWSDVFSIDNQRRKND